jgi:tRNA A37 threonylcarbamoyladenosine synthetase subunit TsaC/SUA5/YrdC
MDSNTAKVISAHIGNIDEIIAHILDNKLVAFPYGKKERRVFALVGLANDTVVAKMKKIKGRDASQGVAIAGIPDVASYVAKLDETKGLVASAKLLNTTPEQLIYKSFDIGAIGLILKAQDWLPQGATMIKDGQRTVLIAGEASKEKYDIFPILYRKLIAEHKKIMVGTSANLHGEDTYHILQQNEALGKLKEHIDVFVYDKLKIGFFPLFKHLTSTTMIDLTEEEPVVIRWGNIYPPRFKKVFPKLKFKPKELKHYSGREKLQHVVLKKIFSSLGF